MKRNLSSKWTLPTKIFNFFVTVIPIFWIAAMLVNFQTWTSETFPIEAAILTMVLGLAWSLFFFFINYRLKFVSVDENNLYVSRLFREKTIPLWEIENVSLTTIGYVWARVRFKSKTEFGRQIFFMPTIVKAFVFSFQRYHPVVEELKILAKVN